jgi:TP901 family phage tail tape measure protein
MANKIAKRGISLYIDGTEVNNSLKGIRAEIRKLTNAQAQMTVGSDAYVASAKKIAELKAILAEYQDELKEVEKQQSDTREGLEGLADRFNRFFGIIASGIAGITGLSLTLRKLAEDIAQLDDIYADVMKTTGMTKDEVIALNEELKKIDTRTSREELNAIAEEGGRIGIAKEEILSFVKAMDIANVALGDSFKGGVEEIANTLGKLKFLFEDTQNMEVEKAYLAIGSAINELGANGVASEANIAEFAKRLGSLSAALKPTSAEALALGAAFEESGIEAEVASRSYSTVLKQASVKAGEFAKIMKVSTKEIEGMINANPLEFFLKFAESMKGLSATDTAKWLKELGLNADGANKAIGAAANSTDRFRELQEIANKAFENGTSVLNEFGIKNNTLAAKLDKAKKTFNEVSLELGNRLYPAFVQATNAITGIIRIIPAAIEWFSKYGKVIITATAAVVAYYTAIKAYTVYQKAANTVMGVARLYTLAKAGATAIATGNTVRATAAMKLYYATLQRGTLSAKIYTAATSLMAAAKALLTGNTVRATAAMRTFNTVLKANPIGFIAAAAVALISGLALLYNKLRDNANALKKFEVTTQEIKEATEQYNKQITEEQTRFNALIRSIVGVNEKSELRKALIKQLKSEYPQYVQYIDLEKASNDELLAVMRNVNKEYEKKYTLAAHKGMVDTHVKKVNEAKVEQLQIKEDIVDLRAGGKDDDDKEIKEKQKRYDELNAIVTRSLRIISEYNTKAAALQKELNDENTYEANNARYLKNRKEIEDLDVQIGNYEYLKEKEIATQKELEHLIKLKEKRTDLEQENLLLDERMANMMAANAAKTKSKTEEDGDLPPAPPVGNDNDSEATKQRKALKSVLEEIEKNHLEAVAAIKKQYAEGDIKTEYEYNQQLLDQQNSFDDERKKKISELLKSVLTDRDVRIEATKEIADIDQKNYDRQIEQANKLKKILLDADPVEAEKQAYENRLRELGLYGDQAGALTEEQYNALALLKKQHEENMSKIDAQGVREKLKELDAEQAAEQARLAGKYRAGLITEGAYQEALLALQKEYLNKKLAIPGLSVEQTGTLNKDRSQNETDTDEFKTAERQKAQETFNLIDPAQTQEEAYKVLEDFEARGVLTHEEAAKAKAQIDQEYLDSLVGKAQDVNNKIQSVTSNLTSAISSFQEAETSAVSRKYDKQIKAAGNNSEKVEKLEEEKEKELSAIRAKYADKQFIVTIAQVTAATALAAMQAFSAMSSIPVIGPALGAVAAAAALAAGAGQIAVAKEQRDAAKEGYASGGYTPSGEWDKPQGVVHSDEFVANRFATNHSILRPVFDVVDYAQRNNTLASLKKEDIAQALGIKGFAAGGYVNHPANGSAPGYDLPQLETLVSVIDRLNEKLDEPFVGEVSITGKKGIKENMDRYDKMIKQTSR